MKKYVAALVAAMYLLMGASVFAKTQIPPTPTKSFYVQDYAGVLSEETKNKINRAGLAVQEKTKGQVVVVTVTRLEDVPMEEYALGILRNWGVGDQKMNNGVVLLVSVEDRQSRIEVGYGLEGALPDGKTGAIQDQYMLPFFKEGKYEEGILNAYMALSQAVLGEYKTTAEGVASPAVASEKSLLDTVIDFIGIAAIIVLVLLDFMFFGGRFTLLVLSLLSRRGGGGGYGGGSGGGGGSSRRW